jgi:hypothetical protein
MTVYYISYTEVLSLLFLKYLLFIHTVIRLDIQSIHNNYFTYLFPVEYDINNNDIGE